MSAPLLPDPKHIAVIDIGKTNAKLVLIDKSTSSQIAILTRANDVISAEPYPHYDIEGFWEFFLNGLAQLHADHRIDAISITTHGATAALMAGDELALPVLDYEHDGPGTMAAEYQTIRPEFSETLSPSLPNGLNLGAQIYWQSKAFASAFSRVTSILMYPQYWAFRLTGISASEVTSLGTHTDLWQPLQKQYSSLVRAQNWQKLFPPLIPARSVLGTIKAEIAARTGLNADVPVACGIHDSNASLLPYLHTQKPPFTIISTGTWTICMSVGGTVDHLDSARDSLANVDADGRPVPTARFMGGREFDLLTNGVSKTPTVADITHVLDQGIMVLPTWCGGVGPFPFARGTWRGDSEKLSAGERNAAVGLYLALMSQTCLELAGVGDQIIVEGPFAQNRLYCAALSAITNKPVFISKDSTGTSLGAAMLFDGPETEIDINLGAPIVPLYEPGLDTYCEIWRSDFCFDGFNTGN